MNLIANTGIQLFNLPIDINLNNNYKMYFHEWFDVENEVKKLEIAHYFSDEDIWIKKRILYNNELGFANVQNNYNVNESWEDISNDEEFDHKSIIPIDSEDSKDSGCFDLSIGRLKDSDWSKFENTWLPMPFFYLKGETTQYGPTNWCRFKLVPVEHKDRVKKYNLVIAFDTRSEFNDEGFEDEDLHETPIFTNASESQKIFRLCNTEENLLRYCSDQNNNNWVDKFLVKHFLGVNNIKDVKLEMPKLRYLANYIFLIRYIQQNIELPDFTLYSNENAPYSNVDLVVDIGNSRTCAVLYDEGNFGKSSPLELQDFTSLVDKDTLKKYRDSFDMRLAFREAYFGGNLGLANSRQFVFPSMVRLGKEANRLIHKAINQNTGSEKTSTFSSPKRFLWDERPNNQEWEFVQLKGESAKPIFINGISEQLDSDGALNPNGFGAVENRYSRKALMTFAFLEILSQARIQINSYKQRNHWGNESTFRKIGKIIVTCPTAMSQKEQIALRKCAEDASIMLDRFYDNTFSEELNEKEARKKVKVIPDNKKLFSGDERKDWIYDEATSSQFVFLYAEINERYKKNVKDYFDFYGKIRINKVFGEYDKKSLTVGSVDIGAGTTDVMISSYKYDDSNAQCKLTPIPLFWESFYVAGDDLLKQLIQNLVIEGQHSPIEKKLRDNNKNPVDVLQPFLGTDNGVSFNDRKLRSDFNLQISVPIVSYYLELLKLEVGDKILSFSDVFEDNPPTEKVLSHFKTYFGFDFQDIQWTYKRSVVSGIVEKVFDSLIGKISSLLSFYDCDIVLLSGRPTSLKPLSDLFLKYYAISPNRFKTMNNYRVGRWYPEDKRYKNIDANGNFIDPKSIITTGAMIGHKAENGGLNGFALDLSHLKSKLLPTTNYFGILNGESLTYIKTIISPEKNHSTINVNALPLRLGTKQLDINSYPSRSFYTINFNEFKIKDRVLGRLDDDPSINEVQEEIEKEKDKIYKAMPLKVMVSRDINEDIEKLTLEEVVGEDGNSMNKNFFSLDVQSMSELDNFWLDSGIFSINLNN